MLIAILLLVSLCLGIAAVFRGMTLPMIVRILSASLALGCFGVLKRYVVDRWFLDETYFVVAPSYAASFLEWSLAALMVYPMADWSLAFFRSRDRLNEQN